MKILSSVEAEPKLHHAEVISERNRGVVGTMASDKVQKSFKWGSNAGDA
jgi:hypothetical protein